MPMEATSRAQLRAWDSKTVPPAEEISAGTWVIPVPMPNPHIPYVLCYAIADDAGGMHLIDPGWATGEAWDSLRGGLEAVGSSVDAVRTATITHAHKDHIGLTKRLRDEVGTRVLISEVESRSLGYMSSPLPPAARRRLAERWGVPPERRAELEEIGMVARLDEHIDFDTPLVDGDELPIPGRHVRVVLTPGHTHGHACLVDADRQLAFTGDHIIPTIHPGIGLGGPGVDNPLAMYNGSLDRIEAFDEFEICPGHGYRFRGLAARVAGIRAHIDRRADEVSAELERMPGAGIWDVAQALTWTEGWENLHGFRLKSALNQVEMYVAQARGVVTPGIGI